MRLTDIGKNRIYKSGTGIQWCFWQWSDAQEPYLNRLFVFKTPWFSVSLNNIKQADVGYPHDHTATFLSIFLKGWYRERRIIKGISWVTTRRFFNFVRAAEWDAHRILQVSPGGMWSLCIMGPKVREWYYHTPTGPVLWSEFGK